MAGTWRIVSKRKGAVTPRFPHWGGLVFPSKASAKKYLAGPEMSHARKRAREDGYVFVVARYHGPRGARPPS